MGLSGYISSLKSTGTTPCAQNVKGPQKALGPLALKHTTSHLDLAKVEEDSLRE
jgi:hypothetical protein